MGRGLSELQKRILTLVYERRLHQRSQRLTRRPVSTVSEEAFLLPRRDRLNRPAHRFDQRPRFLASALRKMPYILLEASFMEFRSGE